MTGRSFFLFFSSFFFSVPAVGRRVGVTQQQQQQQQLETKALKESVVSGLKESFLLCVGPQKKTAMNKTLNSKIQKNEMKEKTFDKSTFAHHFII